jgi:hypothetical protein
MELIPTQSLTEDQIKQFAELLRIKDKFDQLNIVENCHLSPNSRLIKVESNWSN